MNKKEKAQYIEDNFWESQASMLYVASMMLKMGDAKNAEKAYKIHDEWCELWWDWLLEAGHLVESK